MRSLVVAGLSLLALSSLGCVANKVERSRRAVLEAIVLSNEAEPRVERECIAAMKQTSPASDEIKEFCDPIVSEYNQLREQKNKLREAVERLNAMVPDSVPGQKAYEDLDMAHLTAELEETTRTFRATFESWPKLRGAAKEEVQPATEPTEQ